MEIVSGGQRLGSGGILSVVGGRRGVNDGWLWNGRFTEYTDGTMTLDTIQSDSLLNVAKHYWLDGYVPIRDLSVEFLREMEKELRQFYKGGIRVPDTEFLEIKELPEMGLTGLDSTGKDVVRKTEVVVKNDKGEIIGTEIINASTLSLEELKQKYGGS